MKKVLTLIAIVVTLAALFIAILFAALRIVEPPIYAWRILCYEQSDTQDYLIFPARPIANGSTHSLIPRSDQDTPYEVEYPYNGGTHKETLDDLLKRTDTKAFLILKDDQLIFETYLNSARNAINTSFLAAKSFNSALIGAAIADGYIGSVDDPVIKYIPEIAGRGLDPLTIRDLLLMNAGIRYIPILVGVLLAWRPGKPNFRTLDRATWYGDKVWRQTYEIYPHRSFTHSWPHPLVGLCEGL